MKFLEHDKRQKLMELPEVTGTTCPRLVIYVKTDLTDELKKKIDDIMDGIEVTIIKKE